MYGDRIRQREELELERMRLELEELKASMGGSAKKSPAKKPAAKKS